MESKKQNRLDIVSASITDDAISIGELGQLLWSGKLIIISGIILGFIIGKLYSFIPPPVFKADGLVQIETPRSLSKELTDLLGSDKEDISAEIQIIKSRMLMDSVVDLLNLQIQVVPHWFPLFGAAVARASSAELRNPILGLSRYAWGGEKIDVSTLTVPPSLTGQIMTLVAGDQGSYDLWNNQQQKLLAGKVGQLSASQDGSIRIEVSQLIARPGTQFLVSRLTSQQTYDKLAQSMSVMEIGPRSGVLQFTVKGPSPEFVTRAVDAFQGAYLRQNVERKTEDASKTIEFLKAQLPTMKARLDESEAKLTSYLRKVDAVDISEQTTSVLSQSVELEGKLFELQQKKREALLRYTVDHPIVRAIEQEIGSYSDRQKTIASRIDSLPATQQEIFNIRRDLEVDMTIYTTILNSLQSLEVAKAGTVGNVRIIDHAVRPLGPSGPDRGLIVLLSTIVGLGLGIAWTLLRRLLITGVDDPAVIESRLGLPTFAAIPFVNEQRALIRKANLAEGGTIISATAPTSVAAESFKSLRSALHFGLADAPNNIIMLTGPIKGVGKTFVSTNLAVVLAQANKRVLLIDADMRAGVLHRAVNVSVEPGLSQLLASSATLEQVTVKPQLPNVSVIARGKIPPNPAELLLTERFAEFLKTVSSLYDFVIIDTPPVLPVTDASIVGRFAGTSLMVLKAAEHPIRQIIESQSRLASAGISIKGVVLNQVGRKAGSYGYGGYGYRYYEYNS